MHGTNYSKYDFAGRLKDRRLKCGITSCEKLAKEVFPDGNPKSMRKKVEKWENGLSEPTVSEFHRLCEVLECDPEYLWGTIDVSRRHTRTVMEITRLDQDAVDMLVEFTGIISDARSQFLQPSYVISLILKNPSFYEVIREINTNTNYQMLLERVKIEKSLIRPEMKQEYEELITGMKGDAIRIGDNLNEYGYAVVEISELLKMTEYKISQCLGAVAKETITLLHDESVDFLHQLLDDATTEAANADSWLSNREAIDNG